MIFFAVNQLVISNFHVSIEMRTHKATGAFMVLLMAMTLLALASDFRGFELASYFAAGMLYFLCWRLIAFREIYLLGVCAFLS